MKFRILALTIVFLLGVFFLAPSLNVNLGDIGRALMANDMWTILGG